MKNLSAQIDWEKSEGLVPAVVQDANTGAVLMLGYMNKEALAKTLKTKRVWFYSRSKKRLWMKGETSGNILRFVKAATDCDGDALLIAAQPHGPTCHTEKVSCFGDKNFESDGAAFEQLYATIEQRAQTLPKNSYTAHLLRGGLSKISAKVIEESLEVIQAASRETKKRLIEETADLVYHLFVLTVYNKISSSEIAVELQKRRK